MRLINADDLKDWSEIIPLTDDGGIDINDFEEKLESMPTVEAIPVEWIKKFAEESKRHIQGSVNNYTYMYDYMLSEWKQRKERMKYYITCVQKRVSPYGIYEDEERLRELVVCKDCLKKDICLMYRECKDDYGYCSFAKRKEE